LIPHRSLFLESTDGLSKRGDRRKATPPVSLNNSRSDLSCLFLAETNHHFCVTINSAIEFIVGLGSLLDLNPVADDFAGFGAPFTIRSRRCSLYFLTGACPLPMVIPLSKNSAIEKGKMPCFACSLVAPGSGAIYTPMIPMLPVVESKRDGNCRRNQYETSNS
jgi:hypothetical protein